MDAYDLLTPDEVKNGVLFDPDSLFAYRQLDDETIMLVRYTWVTPGDYPHDHRGPARRMDLRPRLYGYAGGGDQPTMGDRHRRGCLLLQQCENGSDHRR